MAALPLTCDLVNPYHERKDKEKKKKKRNIKRDYGKEKWSNRDRQGEAE